MKITPINMTNPVEGKGGNLKNLRKTCEALTGESLNRNCQDNALINIGGSLLCRHHAGEKLLRHYLEPKNWPKKTTQQGGHIPLDNWGLTLTKGERLLQ